MPVPSAFTSGMPDGVTQGAGAHLTLPISGTDRNVLTKLDDVGAYSAMERIEGESLVNFRARIQETNTRRPNATLLGITDGIATALGLGHAPLLNLIASKDLRVTVKGHTVAVSGVGQYDTVDLVSADPDGYWDFPDLYAVASGLNDVSGLSCSVVATASGLPAFLLEEQDSYIRVVGETIPQVQQFQLGQIQGISLAGVKVVTDQVGFTDEEIFAVQVTGSPQRQGEWSVQEDGTVTSFDVPPTVSFVNYTYSLLPSGSTMSLLGNAVKVFNMADPDFQPLFFTASGIGGTAHGVLDEVRAWDKNFWGK